MTVEEDCFKILKFLFERQKQLNDDVYIPSKEVQKETGLSPVQINNAVELLEGANFVKTTSCYGSVPYRFHSLMATPEGKLEVEKRKRLQVEALKKDTRATAITDFAALFGTVYGSSKIEKVYGSCFSQEEIKSLSKAQKIEKILTDCDEDNLKTRLSKIIELHSKHAKEHVGDLKPIIRKLGLDVTDDLKLKKSGQNEEFDYDVALSFAGEDREFAKQLYDALRSEHIKVFYDEAEKAKLWGKDLYTYLSELYSKRTRFCIVFMSKHYAEKGWTIHERKAAQSRALEEGEREFILPIRLDETEVPGILPTVGYLEWKEGIEEIVRCVKEKLEKD